MFKPSNRFVSFVLFYSFLFSQVKVSQIKNLNITGNKNISDKALLLILRQKPPSVFSRRSSFEPRLLKLDALTIKSFYHSKGFLDVKVKDSYFIKNNDVDIIFDINEGRQFFLSEVNFEGNTLISDDKVKEILGLVESKPYDPVGVNNSIYKLENEYHNLAKLFFSIKVQDNITDSAKVQIIIDEGKDVYIDNIYLEKIGKIDSSLVHREITFSKGDLFSKKVIDVTSKRLREMGVFSTANLIPIKVNNSDSLVNIVIEFRKYKQREWNSSGGYDPISFAEGAPELPALSGTIEWRNRSFFNTPKQFSTKLLAGIPVNADFLTPRLRYDASLSGNWFLGIRFPTKITGYFERFIIYNANIYEGEIDRFGTNLSQKITFYNRSFIETNAVWESFSDKTEEKFEERSISLKLNIDKKNMVLYTTKGYLFKSLFKIAGFGGGREYQKIDFTFQNYFPVNKKTVFATRLQSGKIWGWRELNNSDYSYEKFYLGGSTSMRGWDVLRFKENDENRPFGSTIRLMTNLEIRSNIYKTFGITVFADGGLLENKIKKITRKNAKWDGGLGLTVETPLGPARLDYAIRLDDKSKWKIQLGVQSLF